MAIEAALNGAYRLSRSPALPPPAPRPPSFVAVRHKSHKPLVLHHFYFILYSFSFGSDHQNSGISLWDNSWERADISGKSEGRTRVRRTYEPHRTARLPWRCSVLLFSELASQNGPINQSLAADDRSADKLIYARATPTSSALREGLLAGEKQTSRFDRVTSAFGPTAEVAPVGE